VRKVKQTLRAIKKSRRTKNVSSVKEKIYSTPGDRYARSKISLWTYSQNLCIWWCV